jgi:hypothetical protein
MTGLYDRKPGDPTSQSNAEATLPEHPHGHEREYGRREVTWERWQKKRTFVRALEGTYSDLTKPPLNQPRVYSSRSMPWKCGPQVFGKHVHGHMNSARALRAQGPRPRRPRQQAIRLEGGRPHHGRERPRESPKISAPIMSSTCRRRAL